MNDLRTMSHAVRMECGCVMRDSGEMLRMCTTDHAAALRHTQLERQRRIAGIIAVAQSLDVLRTSWRRDAWQTPAPRMSDKARAFMLRHRTGGVTLPVTCAKGWCDHTH